MQALAIELDITNQVEFMGHIPHPAVVDAYQGLDLAVFPSIVSESFGVAVLEASACGVPVVVSDIGGLPEVILDNVTGLKSPPNDPQALAAAMQRLINDADLRLTMGQQARQFVCQHYDWSQNVAVMASAYAHQ